MAHGTKEPPVDPTQMESGRVRVRPCCGLLAFVKGHPDAPDGFAFWLSRLAPEEGMERTTLWWAWQQCPRAQWMLWLAHALGVDRDLVREAEASARAARERAERSPHGIADHGHYLSTCAVRAKVYAADIARSLDQRAPRQSEVRL